jgi:putative endonuclease
MANGRQNASVGRYGERVAERHLVAGGMLVLDRNWRCSAGEIDLVLRDGNALVICEVKTRRDVTHGHPLTAVDAAKTDRLHRLAALWQEDHGIRPAEVRLDVVGVLVSRCGPAAVEHVRGIG